MNESWTLARTGAPIFVVWDDGRPVTTLWDQNPSAVWDSGRTTFDSGATVFDRGGPGYLIWVE